MNTLPSQKQGGLRIHAEMGSQSLPTLSKPESHAIFREMVRGEMAGGELNAARRRRLVQYAASLHISAVESGRLIQECVRAHAREHGAAIRPQTTNPRLRVVADQPAHTPTLTKLSLLLAGVLVAKIIVFGLIG